MAVKAETGDPYIRNVQVWLNNNFGDDSRYNKIEENGKIGWATINAMIRGLQIELGIQVTADNFGNGTKNAFKNKYKNGIVEQTSSDGEPQKIYGIIQGALICKGYGIGVNTPTGYFLSKTGEAVKKLKTHAGIDASNSTVTLHIMESLLSMDYFYSYNSSDKTKNIQKIQRYLNANYEDFIDGLIPCDGIYGRGTNKALIYAIQSEEGMPSSVANGNFGPSTKKFCPTIPYNNVESNYNGLKYSDDKIKRFTILVNMGLYVNGIGDGNFNSNIYSANIKQFQARYALPFTGTVNLSTWLSMFISSGDTSRSAKACDCATILTTEKAKTLYDNGYRYVGRYLSGTAAGNVSKALSKEELQIAFAAGLRVFPIQQGSATRVSYFTEAQAILDVDNAYKYANSLSIPAGTVIYFAVDCDPLDTEITSNIIPYFKKVFENMRDEKNSKFRIGIYGTRNVCTRVSDKGYAVRSFVSDMSTGFSGNLGFRIPSNWAFDQFATVTVGKDSGKIEIDKDGFSGLDYGIDHISTSDEELDTTPDPDYSVSIGYDTKSPQPTVMVNVSSKSINVYSSKAKDVGNVSPAKEELEEMCLAYNEILAHPAASNIWTVTGKKVGEIKPGDLFVRFNCQSHEYDNDPSFKDRVMNYGDSAHKVLFRDSDGVVRYGYIQELLTPARYNYKDSVRYERENFQGYNFDPENNKLKKNELDLLDAIFTVKRELDYISNIGEKLGTLKVGTQITGVGEAGANFNEYIAVLKVRENENSEWKYLNSQSNEGGFVCLDMKNGVNGYDRALW